MVVGNVHISMHLRLCLLKAVHGQDKELQAQRDCIPLLCLGFGA